MPPLKTALPASLRSESERAKVVLKHQTVFILHLLSFKPTNIGLASIQKIWSDETGKRGCRSLKANKILSYLYASYRQRWDLRRVAAFRYRFDRHREFK